MDIQIEHVLTAFRQHGFSAQYFDTGAQATAYLALQAAGKEVSFGGSMTLEHLGAYEALCAAGANVHWHWKNNGQIIQACDIYVTSANALSKTGEIVNIDGTGNRVSASCYGARECYTVCGINKLAPTLTAAITRARKIAAPLNAQRLHCHTPCAVDGKCHDCQTPDRICRVMTIQMMPPLGFEQCTLLLVGESFGF